MIHAFDVVADDRGDLFSPASCARAYTYDGSNNLLTDTATDGGQVRIKTYGYTGTQLSSETKWVRQ